MSSDAKSELRKQRLLFIVRLSAPERLEEMVRTIWDAGGRFVEITLNSPGALQALESLAGNVPAGSYLGAGTVCAAGDVERVSEAGVSFVVSPVVSRELVEAVRRYGLMGIIGASTPTEIHNAFSWGADFVKVFPAQSPEYIRLLRGPLNDIPLVAVGGVRQETAIKFLNAGCVAVAVGVSVFGVQADGVFEPDEVTAVVRAMVKVCELKE